MQRHFRKRQLSTSYWSLSSLPEAQATWAPQTAAKPRSRVTRGALLGSFFFRILGVLSMFATTVAGRDYVAGADADADAGADTCLSFDELDTNNLEREWLRMLPLQIAWEI